MSSAQPMPAEAPAQPYVNILKTLTRDLADQSAMFTSALLSGDSRDCGVQTILRSKTVTLLLPSAAAFANVKGMELTEKDLKFHILQGEWPLSEIMSLTEKQAGTLKNTGQIIKMINTAAGNSIGIIITQSNEQPSINICGANVVIGATDIKASNGYIHVIDTVLMSDSVVMACKEKRKQIEQESEEEEMQSKKSKSKKEKKSNKK